MSELPDSGDGWTLREALGSSWRWYVDKPAGPGWLPAKVPGSVVGALMRAGEIPDPYVGRQSRFAEWTADRHWVYQRLLDAVSLTDGDRAVLELDGVDPGGRVFVDGTQVGRITGLHHPFRADITELVSTPGPHRLAVVVEPVPESESQVGRTDAVRIHAPRLNYGWDFCPRFPHQGIWRPARLEVGRAHAYDVVVCSETSGDLATGLVRVDASVEGVADDLVVALLDGDRVVDQATALPATLEVVRPRLWWPNRHGEQATYTVEIRDGSRVLWSGRTGFRHVRMLPDPGADDGALPYTAEVNGVLIPLVGWNWAPVDAQHGEVTAERVRHLVRLAADSGARLLRVWGGGLVETPDFYDACDEAGLLVWQEFSQSSSGTENTPSDDPGFVEMMRAEARTVVPSRRRHPCLLMWGGGNELDVDGVAADEATSPVLGTLRDAVAVADPGRHWVPTSPSGVKDEHDVHGPWEHQGLVEHYRLYNRGISLAHTEFGVEGMANRRAFESVVPEADRWPLDRSNPVMNHLGDWWDNEPLVQESFGHRLRDPDAVRRASQLLQATGLQYAVEADRRRAPRCSMVLPWQLNESYPNAWCTAVVDHLGEPKPAYHAVARAFADDRVTLRVDRAVWPDKAPSAEVWLWSTGGVPAGSSVEVRVLDEDGEPLASWSWTDLPAAGDPEPIGVAASGALPVDDGAVLLWDARWTAADGTPIDRTVEVMTAGGDWSGLLDLAPARLEVTDTGVRHVDGPVLVGLRLADARPADAPDPVRYAGDPRPLLPGEERCLELAPYLTLDALNLDRSTHALP